jgi:hypothetical protein
MPLHDDEFEYAKWFELFRRESVISALRRGLSVGYLTVVQIAGGDWSFRFAGRAVGALTAVLLGVTLWRMSRRLGLSPLARRLAMLTFLNLVLAGQGFLFMAISDGVFAVATLWVLLAIDRAIEDRRPGLAIAAGAGWALTTVMRPVAHLFNRHPCGLAALIWRDPERRRVRRPAVFVVAAFGTGFLALQIPAVLSTGKFAVEKASPKDNWPERRTWHGCVSTNVAARSKNGCGFPDVTWTTCGDTETRRREGRARQARRLRIRGLGCSKSRSTWRSE